ncbi:aldose 1-epimerase family protein [Ruania suaedae]|uniref:aldose 1-epimerase family protein n=1 Tax=Ruania suaedae TaxID=2897774 RepID=UPI001E474FB9|nr:aldose 1-epimerase family protein [Ruania suaedae]UFU02642.1 aldose 1-epimerase family protein [Ruania suaedae]
MTIPALPGTGEYLLRHGDQTAVVVETGGGLREYAVGGAEIVAGYPAETVCVSARGQWLVPWPNRISGARYSYDGAEHLLPVDDPDADNAIHGLARWLPFQVVDRAEQDWIELGAVLPARAGYPWSLTMNVRWELGESGLTSTLTVRNTGMGVAPFGAGTHPYLHAGEPGTLVDEAELTLGARTVLTGDRSILTERAPLAEHPEHDFRSGRRIGDHQFVLYTDLDRDDEGNAHTVLDRADGLRVDLWQDQAWPFVLLYSADGVSEQEGRRASLAVEPMTCPADAFHSGDGLLELAPGDVFTGAWGIRVG